MYNEPDDMSITKLNLEIEHLSNELLSLESMLEYSRANNKILNKNLDLKYREVEQLRSLVKLLDEKIQFMEGR